MNDLSTAKYVHYKREVTRLSECMANNPQAWREVEARVLTIAQDQKIQVIVDATNLATGNLASLHGKLQQPQISDNPEILGRGRSEQDTS